MVAHFGKYCAYFRVSTGHQGIDGYGIDAQRKVVADYLNGGKWTLVGEFTEVESGKRRSRPELQKALAACKKQKAKLVVAKLDRLARNTKFLLAIIDSGVEVLFCDLPQIPGAMGRFVVILMAAIAELEAGLISERTKAGLASAQRRGMRLGRTGSLILAPRHRAEARARAVELAPVMRELADLSANQAAAELNRRKVASATGGKWHAATVIRLRERINEGGVS